MGEMKKYLDLDGLIKYDENLKSYIDKLFSDYDEEAQEKLEWKELGAEKEGE